MEILSCRSKVYESPYPLLKHYLIVHFPDYKGDLAINIAYTQRDSQIQSLVTIPVWDLGINWHIECLATRAVDLGWGLTQEAAEEQQQHGQSPKWTYVVSHSQTLSLCFRVS